MKIENDLLNQVATAYGTQISLADQKDATEILNLYQANIGHPGVTWNQFYPGLEEIQRDTELHALYCLKRPDNKLIGVMSAGSEREFDELEWGLKASSPCELSRLGILPSFQHQGWGHLLFRLVLMDMKARGFDVARLLVAKYNSTALGIYQAAKFNTCGETHLFDIDFQMMEKQL